MPSLENDVTDATQRVNVNAAGQPTAPQQPNRPAQRPDTSRRHRAAAAAARKRKERNTLIAVGIGAAVLLLVVLIILGFSLFRSPDDDGKIRSNVLAAGIDLGGMTPDQAKKALHAATDNTYSKLNMTIHILNTEVILAPGNTLAKLDVDAVVDAAYKYGRGDSATNDSSTYTISILPYLNLNTDYIQSMVSDLGTKYGTLRTPTTITVEGERPAITPGKQDTSVAYQVLDIKKGTAEYQLKPDVLYGQILDAYNTNIFEVTANCTEIAPPAFDYDAFYAEHKLYVEPQNAVWDDVNYVVNPKEIYGYGITQDALKILVDSMAYGETKSLPLYYIEPEITSSFYSQDVFKDTLYYYESALPNDKDWKHNVEKACALLDGKIIKANEEFSFLQAVTRPTSGTGWRSVNVYVGKSLQKLEGGGICQVATALYNCALRSDLDILERYSHSYLPSYLNYQLEADADIHYGGGQEASKDLRFRNNTGSPIRIKAAVKNGKLTVEFIGTNSRNYRVELVFKIDKVKNPNVVYNTMTPDNPGGYKDGDVLEAGLIGYDISITMRRIDVTNGRLISENVVAVSYFSKLDTVIVKIYTPPEEPSPEPEPEPEPEPTPDPTPVFPIDPDPNPTA